MCTQAAHNLLSSPALSNPATIVHVLVHDVAHVEQTCTCEGTDNMEIVCECDGGASCTCHEYDLEEQGACIACRSEWSEVYASFMEDLSKAVEDPNARLIYNNVDKGLLRDNIVIDRTEESFGRYNISFPEIKLSVLGSQIRYHKKGWSFKLRRIMSFTYEGQELLAA